MSGVNCVGYGYLNVDSTAIGLVSCSTQGIPGRAKGLIVTIENAGVRLRLDGTNPTSAVNGGDLLNAGDSWVLDSWTVPNINWASVMKNANFISSAGDGSTGKLSIHFFD